MHALIQRKLLSGSEVYLYVENERLRRKYWKLTTQDWWLGEKKKNGEKGERTR